MLLGLLCRTYIETGVKKCVPLSINMGNFYPPHKVSEAMVCVNIGPVVYVVRLVVTLQAGPFSISNQSAS